MAKLNKYSRGEYNARLSQELERGRLSFELKRLFYLLAQDVANQKRYQYLREEVKEVIALRGYEGCVQFWQKYNPDKWDRERNVGSPYAYFTIVVRSAAAGVIADVSKARELVDGGNVLGGAE